VKRGAPLSLYIEHFISCLRSEMQAGGLARNGTQKPPSRTQSGRPKIRIREAFADAQGNVTPEFMAAYWKALEAINGRVPSPPSLPREKTFYWLVDQYYKSEVFKRFDILTRADKRSVLDRYCQTAGPLPYAALRKEDVEASRDKRSATPGAADKLVKYLRALFNWAIDMKHATSNPAIGVAKINESDGWHTWTPAEVDAYRGHHAIGTKARLALELMINIGARISDAATVGRQHESDGWLKFVAWKNRNKKSRKVIECPITPELRAALSATSVGALTYLVTDRGRAFTINGLGNKMRDWCDAAGLPQCSSHGLRKAAAVILAENGATAPELCALFGWSKLETAEIYIREAQKRKMVANAFARLHEYRTRKSVSVSGPPNANGTKDGKRREKTKRKECAGWARQLEPATRPL
jgi:integrase